MARAARFYADHILDAIETIEADIAGHDFDSFRADCRTRQLAERNLEIISEASRRLSEDMKGTQPGIPWAAIAGIGNMLRHDYHRSHPIVLWETCKKDLAPLQAAVTRIQRRARRESYSAVRVG